MSPPTIPPFLHGMETKCEGSDVHSLQCEMQYGSNIGGSMQPLNGEERMMETLL